MFRTIKVITERIKYSKTRIKRIMHSRKDTLNIGRLGKALIKLMMILLTMNLLFHLIQIPIAIFSQKFSILVQILAKLAIISTILYFIYKRNNNAFYALALISAISLSGIIRGVSQTEGIFGYLLIYDLISIIFLISSIYVIYKSRSYKTKFTKAVKYLNKK